MARLSDINVWMQDPDERYATVLRAVVDSSRCEGIDITEGEIDDIINEVRPLQAPPALHSL